MYGACAAAGGRDAVRGTVAEDANRVPQRLQNVDISVLDRPHFGQYMRIPLFPFLGMFEYPLRVNFISNGCGSFACLRDFIRGHMIPVPPID